MFYTANAGMHICDRVFLSAYELTRAVGVSFELSIHLTVQSSERSKTCLIGVVSQKELRHTPKS